MSGSVDKKQYTSPGDPRVIGSAAFATNNPDTYVGSDGPVGYDSN